jgi:hypothetical protein
MLTLPILFRATKLVVNLNDNSLISITSKLPIAPVKPNRFRKVKFPVDANEPIRKYFIPASLLFYVVDYFAANMYIKKLTKLLFPKEHR